MTAPRPIRNPDVTPLWKQERPPKARKPLRAKRWGIKPSARTVAKNRARVEHLNDQRQVAFIRDGWACRRCGSTRGLHAHHVRRRSQARNDDASNLVTVCQGCHEFIHRNPAEAREKGWLA